MPRRANRNFTGLILPVRFIDGMMKTNGKPIVAVVLAKKYAAFETVKLLYLIAVTKKSRLLVTKNTIPHNRARTTIVINVRSVAK